MKKTHQWMLFFLFLFFVSEILACTKKEEKLVFYQTTQIQKMDDSKEDTQFFQEEAQTSQVSESSLHETTQAAVETIAVYLCGEVCKPGVYVLQAGSRLYQAVEEAGGLTANAQAEAVNLARILADSEQIYIPNISESIDQIENETQNVISSAAAVPSASSDNLLNINQASESELMQLPGIGGVISPDFTLFPKYSGGIYREGAQTVVVSRGLGTHSVPVRLWNWPELIVLELSGTSEEM